MSRPTPLERLGLELEAAAARQAVTTVPRRRRGRRRLLALAILLLGAGAAGGSWAATSLLSQGSPVPYLRGAPIAGRAQGAPIPATVKLLTDRVADPDGGPPWGLRYWETDRKYACVQVGRVYDGKLGQISGGNVFHELRLGVTGGALGNCFALDGAGHAFAAVHTDARRGGQPQPCPTGIAAVRPARCTTERTVDFGLLGPNAKRFTYRAGGQDHTAAPLGDAGAYLVVQRRIEPVMREYGFHHRDPKLNVRGPAEAYLALTPASQVIARVDYTGGSCTVHVTQEILGACDAEAGYVPIPVPDAGDVRAPIHAFLAPGGERIRVRFRAREAVVDGRSGYTIEVRPAGGHGFVTHMYSRNVAAGDMVRTTVGLYDHRRGPYRIVVRYRTVRSRPGPVATLAYPGLLVGQARVDVP